MQLRDCFLFVKIVLKDLIFQLVIDKQFNAWRLLLKFFLFVRTSKYQWNVDCCILLKYDTSNKLRHAFYSMFYSHAASRDVYIQAIQNSDSSTVSFLGIPHHDCVFHRHCARFRLSDYDFQSGIRIFNYKYVYSHIWHVSVTIAIEWVSIKRTYVTFYKIYEKVEKQFIAQL